MSIFTYDYTIKNEDAIEHKFIIPIEMLKGTFLDPDFDWSNYKHECDCDEE